MNQSLVGKKLLILGANPETIPLVRNPEKVKQVVLLQQRMVPICATRGQRIVPWKIFG